MAGLVPAIYALAVEEGVDHRDKPGDDNEKSPQGIVG
jgi:hypothetical protein